MLPVSAGDPGPHFSACRVGGSRFKLKNCKPMECTSPRASMEDGYIVHPGSRHVTMLWEDGYGWTPTG